MMKIYFKYILAFLICSSIISCKKMIEVSSPKTQLTPDNAFADDLSAIAVISNIYAQFNSLIDAGISPAIGTYSDELSTTSANSTDLEYYNGWISVINSNNLITWQSFYSVIYQCNSLLENIEHSPNISATVKQQLKGEALFLRSISYFYLVNLYGDVPLLLTANVKITSVAARASTTDVYTQIVSDLTQAKNLVAESYPSNDKVRANKWAAVALLARVYLFQKDWINAESESNAVISSGNYNPLDNLPDVFKINSKESILQFWTREGFTTVGLLFIPTSGSIPTYPITTSLINSFEPGDQRRYEWVDSVVQGTDIFYYPYKYKNRTPPANGDGEYLNLLRLGEQYLIRAEAKAQQSNIAGAQGDLNIIRNRAGLSNTIANDKSSLLLAIEHERQIELFSEWGHRFFDLKRTGRINQVMSPLKPAWRDASSLLPIPQYERLNNPNLTQNTGY